MKRASVGSTNRRKSIVQTLVSSLENKFDEETETNRLEAEIAEDEKPVSRSRLSRLRRKGALILHSKQVLMVIVLLNVIDCLLVTGELILDIHYIKDILEESEVQSGQFINEMQARYPSHLHGHTTDQLGEFHSVIYKAKCYWDTDIEDICGTSNMRRKLLGTDDPDSTTQGKAYVTSTKSEGEPAHSVWEDVAHGMHKASIAILGVLFLENVFKVFFMGMGFFHRKIEVFDAFVVVASFILDLVFLKGLIVYRIQDGVLILSFLLPWRVIRVVNSLIVAILDHEHFRLKMMYKEKKKLAYELDTEQQKTDILKEKLRNIEEFLENEGMPRWKFVHYTHFDEKNTSVSSMASLALKGMVHGFFNAQNIRPTLDRIDEQGDTVNLNNNKENGNQKHGTDTHNTHTTNGLNDNLHCSNGSVNTQSKHKDDAMVNIDNELPLKERSTHVQIDTDDKAGLSGNEESGITNRPLSGYDNPGYVTSDQVCRNEDNNKIRRNSSKVRFLCDDPCDTSCSNNVDKPKLETVGKSQQEQPDDNQAQHDEHCKPVNENNDVNPPLVTIRTNVRSNGLDTVASANKANGEPENNSGTHDLYVCETGLSDRSSINDDSSIGDGERSDGAHIYTKL